MSMPSQKPQVGGEHQHVGLPVMTKTHLEEQLLVLLPDDRRIRKYRFWLDWRAYGQEQAETKCAVQPDLISSSLPESHKHKRLRILLPCESTSELV
jgi:hypothetical protein